VICVRDFTKGITRVSPADKTVDRGLNPLFSYPVLHVRYLNHDGEETDVVGQFADIEELLEDQTWASTLQGSRLPSALKSSPEGQKYSWAKYDRA
jgi:hypothetical protein